MRQQRADHLQLHAIAIGQGRVRMSQQVGGEVKPDLLLGALHDPVNVRVRQRPPDPAAPQIHEHEIAVQIAVFLVHVVRPQPHQLRRDRHPTLSAALAPRPPRRPLRADHDPSLPRDHILVIRNPSACPIRIPVEASSANKNRSRNRS